MLELDAFVLMPDHMHAIVRLMDDEHGMASLTVSTVIQWFKTMTTNAYIRAVRHDGWPAFGGRLWQRGFHDRIVRDPLSLSQFRQYIADNPAMSGHDRPGGECSGANTWVRPYAATTKADQEI